MSKKDNDFVVLEIDFNKARDSVLKEDWALMFGSWIKMLLGGLFQGIEIPVTIRGTRSEIESFANVLNREKKYIQAWKDKGLNNPETYKNKTKLDSAINEFEKVTNIKWPFGK